MAAINIGNNQEGITFTQSAADKVAELIKEEDNFDLNLRVFITGGGCSGFQYGFTFDEEIQEDDSIIERSVDKHPAPIKLLIDPMSYQYLNKAEIDYREDLQGAQFVIKNPMAKTTCGCGSSFSIAEDEEDDK